MNESKNPTDIAREALKRLAVRHLPPTPANFQSCYNEIAGLPDLPPFAEAPLRQLAATLVPRGEAQEAELDNLGSAIVQRSWQGETDALQASVVPVVNIVLLGVGTVGMYLIGRARGKI